HFEEACVPGTRVPIVAGQRCPRCSAHTLYRSQLRSFSERIRKKLTEKRLYRCEGCGWRGWTQNLDAALVHTLSQPEKGSARTGTGLCLVASLGVLWLGLTAALTDRLVLRIARGIVVVGFILAVAGIAGLASPSGKVLGFWQPLSHAAPFGPFINRNHYAGWMLMTVPFGLGYLISRLARSAGGPPRSWRARIAWLSTRDANLTIMLGLGLMLMALTVLVSLSRSGIVCLVLGLIGFGWFASRRRAKRSGRALLIACVMV